MMTRPIGFALALCTASVLAVTPATARNEQAWDDASSIARDGLVVVALGLPAVQGDWNGTLQAGGSVAAAAVASRGLKEIFPELRPDGSDRKSFPSGHTSVAFAAAASLHNRYGWEIGLPAQIVAAFTGFSRIQARKHHWYDVVAGAAIGEASGFLLTNKRDANVRLLPWGDSQGGGVTLGMAF